MKKLISIFSLFFLITAAGCSSYLPTERRGGDMEIKNPSPTRTYMDELSGNLVSFHENELYLQTDNGKFYKFDVSSAELQCKNGMISGSPVSVIYEGRLSGQDGNTVKALKVIDPYGRKQTMKEQTVFGKLQEVTANTVTVRQKNGIKIQFPSVNAKQSYQNGLKLGTWVYIHFLGTLEIPEPSKKQTLRPENIKVLSVSDTENVTAPQPTPTHPPDPKEPVPHSVTGELLSIEGTNIQLQPKRTGQVYSFDIHSASVFLYSGLSEGSEVTLDYLGEIKETDTSAVRVLSVRDREPSRVRENDFQNHITGVIQTSTQNTITVRVSEGLDIVCDIQHARNSSSIPLEAGTAVSLFFNPEASEHTNLYKISSIGEPYQRSI